MWQQVIYDMHDGMGGVTELMMRWAKEEMFLSVR